LLTPVTANQQSLVMGDFTGQFVAFAQYQAERLAQGEIPLWNPYNLGGHPFLADTQSAVFYPPRLVTIAILNATGGSTPQRMVDALQKEMVAHMLIASWLMYWLMRRLTERWERHSLAAALIAAVTFAYGGYLTGYPQLQLAVMEAGVWLPMALVGIWEASQRTARAGMVWIALAGVGLGLSFLAGHPQTTYFFILTALAWLGFTVCRKRRSWLVFPAYAMLFGALGAGIAAVQLLPGWEYLGLTTRSALNVDALGNGFPFTDVLQILMPGQFSLWSPLYFGIGGLLLALCALIAADHLPDVRFWALLALAALLLSFGRNTIVYDVVYTLLPGGNLFRGQERSAYVIALSTAVLAGYGTLALFEIVARSRVRRMALSMVTAVLALFVFHGYLLPTSTEQKTLAGFSLLVTSSAWLLIPRLATVSGGSGSVGIRWREVSLLLTFVVFELFTFGRFNPNLEPIPAANRLHPSPLWKPISADVRTLYRTDGLPDNAGTLYRFFDIGGISPLKLASVERARARLGARAWDVFAVRYVITPNEQLPVPSTIMSRIDDPYMPLKLHMITPSAQFARLVYRAWIEPDTDTALGLMSDPAYDLRGTVMLQAEPSVTLPAEPPTGSTAEIRSFLPEYVEVWTGSPTEAILNIALVNYLGWQAYLDGQPTPILLADTLMSAVVVPAGDHRVVFRFEPHSYQIGAAISLVTIAVLMVGVLLGSLRVFSTTTRRAA
jgi:hypothetical protein